MAQIKKILVKFIIIQIIFLLLLTNAISSLNITIEKDNDFEPTNNANISNFKIDLDKRIEKSLISDDWFFYPVIPNYSPSGMPDFSQMQDGWQSCFCGPTSVADVFWYIDSKFEDPQGYPGDGYNIFNMVDDYNAPGNPDPGPYKDDHNYNNVNDLGSVWEWGSQNPNGYELIERAAVYLNTTVYGTPRNKMYPGIAKWIKDVGLENCIIVKDTHYPTFNQIAEEVLDNKYVILLYHAYDSECNYIYGHYVTVAGINTNTNEIAVSDPYFDIENGGQDPIEHNNAYWVSHDVYTVNLRPHCGNGKWAIESSTGIYGEILFSIVMYDKTEPYLQCEGNFNWTGIKPGELLQDSFNIRNVGCPTSELNWTIVEFPIWGTWTFMPSNGTNLKPEDGNFPVDFTVEIPDEPNQNYYGEIKIVNIENVSNFGIIPIYLSISKSIQSNFSIFIQKFLRSFQNEFPILRLLFQGLGQ